MDEPRTRLRIAVITRHDPYNRQAWSGTMYYMMQALERYCGEVTSLGPSPYAPWTARIYNQFTQRILHRTYDYIISMPAARRHAHVFERKLSQRQFDVIVAMDADVEIALLQTAVPIVFLSASTQRGMIDYYPSYTNLLPRSIRDYEAIDRLAIARATFAVYSSEWAARSAIDDFGASPQRVNVVPYGANLDIIPDRERALNRPLTDTCRLFFLSRYWERKGGDIAYETLQALEQRGVQAALTVCGCTPSGISHPRLRVIPVLDKRIESHRQALEDEYARHDFFLLPTRADCTPIVFCEANAYGMPVISTDTGGVSGVIRSGENGVLLPYAARGDAYAEQIAAVYRQPQRYAEMVHASRQAFEERLNWDAWGQSMYRLFGQLPQRQGVTTW